MRTAGVGRTHGVNAIMPKVMMPSNKSASDEETADGWISVATSPIALWRSGKWRPRRPRQAASLWPFAWQAIARIDPDPSQVAIHACPGHVLSGAQAPS